MSKCVYFVSNIKVPNIKLFLNNKQCLYSSRKEARVILRALKSTATKPGLYKIYKVSTTTVR